LTKLPIQGGDLGGGKNGAVRADVHTGAAMNTVRFPIRYLRFLQNGFGVLAPKASEITPFEKNRRTDPRTIIYTELLDIEDKAFAILFHISRIASSI
jgi:hypothetical protein